jgi:hypothetical protein
MYLHVSSPVPRDQERVLEVQVGKRPPPPARHVQIVREPLPVPKQPAKAALFSVRVVEVKVELAPPVLYPCLRPDMLHAEGMRDLGVQLR